jgi:hypothetical protein
MGWTVTPTTPTGTQRSRIIGFTGGVVEDSVSIRVVPG